MIWAALAVVAVLAVAVVGVVVYRDGRQAGARDERERQEQHADAVETELEDRDAEIELWADGRVREARLERSRAAAHHREEMARTPTREEVEALIRESKE